MFSGFLIILYIGINMKWFGGVLEGKLYACCLIIPHIIFDHDGYFNYACITCFSTIQFILLAFNYLVKCEKTMNVSEYLIGCKKVKIYFVIFQDVAYYIIFFK